MSCHFLASRRDRQPGTRAVTILCGVQDGSCFLTARLQTAAAGENPVLVGFTGDARAGGVEDVLERAAAYAIVPRTLRAHLLEELAGSA